MISISSGASRILRNSLKVSFKKTHHFPQRRLLSLKYDDIDTFNKQKTEFKYRHADFSGINESSETGTKNNKIDQKNVTESLNFADLNTDSERLWASHPSLQGLRPNSPDYKHQLFMLQQQEQADQERQKAHWEFMERLKAIGIGALALVGIISAYLLVMNYKHLKGYIRNKMDFDFDISQVADMNDPKENTKLLANLAEKLAVEMDSSFADSIKPSTSVPGIYAFGAISGKKLPMRIPGFDGMYFSHVLVTDKCLVAVNDSGDVFHYAPGFQAPIKVRMPCKISSVHSAGGNFYYVASNKRDIYMGLTVSSEPTPGRFFSSSSSYTTAKIQGAALSRSERFLTITSGRSHLLLLSSNGRLFQLNASIAPDNKGQFGLPIYSPSLQPQIPMNVIYELSNMNNQVLSLGTEKTLIPRVFTSVASGQNHNLAVESNGNVWAWGDNTFCQCGKEASSYDDIQPVPKIIFTPKELARILKFSLPDHGANGTFSVEKVFASNETSFMKLRFSVENCPSRDQDLILSFGNGLMGQLGLSRYVHKTAQPYVIKSLVNLKEYDEKTQQTSNIAIEALASGGDHVFLTMQNCGRNQRDVLVFGNNLSGQFGNGKTVKSSKPTNLPKLLEPEDFQGRTSTLARKVNDQLKNRLVLTDGTIGSQDISAGENSSVIFYRRT